MGSYAVDYNDIQPRLGGRLLTATSTVTTTQVNAWILEAEAELNQGLIALGLTAPVVSANAILILKNKVVARVVNLVVTAWTIGTTLEGSPVAEREGKEWDDFLTLMQEQPGKVATLMGQAFGTTAGTSDLRAYTTDNTDSKTIRGGDFDPVFTRGKAF